MKERDYLSHSLLRMNKRGTHNGSTVNEGIMRQTLGIEHQLIEVPSRGLSPHMFVNQFFPALLTGDRIGDGLGGGLRTEGNLGVPNVESLPVNRADGDSKVCGVHPG